MQNVIISGCFKAVLDNAKVSGLSSFNKIYINMDKNRNNSREYNADIFILELV